MHVALLDSFVGVGGWENHGYRHYEKFRLSDPPNNFVGHDDLKGLVVNPVDRRSVRQGAAFAPKSLRGRSVNRMGFDNPLIRIDDIILPVVTSGSAGFNQLFHENLRLSVGMLSTSVSPHGL
jgi:hypothetical protein